MSYGINAPQGFVETIPLTGATWNTATSVYPIKSGYATSIYTGDPVTASQPGGNGDGTIAIGVAGSGVYGVFKGVIYTDANNIKQILPYWPGGTATLGTANAEAFVIDDPNVEFDIQATARAIVETDIGKNANFVIAAGSTRSGITGTSLAANTAALTATLSCKILRLTPVVSVGSTSGFPNNTFGTPFNNVIVTFNNHLLKGGTGTAGTNP